MKTRRIVLARTPEGIPRPDDFEMVTEELGAPGPDQVLVKQRYLSIDPYVRSVLRFPKRVGQTVVGGAVGQVVDSGSDNIPVGSFVRNEFGWCEHFVADQGELQVLNPEDLPVATYLGALGMTGFTAWAGLSQVAKAAPGEVVFVSAAAGAVGSMVGQIAAQIGCTVIGSTGNDDSVSFLTEELGFDHAFNYKRCDALQELRKAAPDGIDVYFENVGGPQLEAALEHMRPWGRIPVCGMIATYNDSAKERTPGPRNLSQIIYKRITIRGFLVGDFQDQEDEFLTQMRDWVRSGKIATHQTLLQGLEAAPAAFIRLFQGSHRGKLLVELDA
jgi:NADPH-dependent curcumin reductase CurA